MMLENFRQGPKPRIARYKDLLKWYPPVALKVFLRSKEPFGHETGMPKVILNGMITANEKTLHPFRPCWLIPSIPEMQNGRHLECAGGLC